MLEWYVPSPTKVKTLYLTLVKYSTALTGTQIDAIYHTSIVVGGVEYYFGQGIQTATPGSTHHGRPMETLHLGKTELPTEVIEEYLGSLAEVYTPEVCPRDSWLRSPL